MLMFEEGRMRFRECLELEAQYGEYMPCERIRYFSESASDLWPVDVGTEEPRAFAGPLRWLRAFRDAIRSISIRSM